LAHELISQQTAVFRASRSHDDAKLLTARAAHHDPVASAAGQRLRAAKAAESAGIAIGQ
jgi:hypothetical protein